MFEKLDKTLDGFLKLGTPGYDMCIYKDGECIYRRMDGYSDRERGIAMAGDELYYIYSVTKLITVTAALQLYEKGVFSLDDKLSKYVPEYAEMTVREADGSLRPAKSEITVRDLFRMTAGFNYRMKGEAMVKFRDATEGRCPTRLLARYMADAILDFDPGTKWQYSLCHDVLASFVEIWTGRRFGEYVKENIFDVAGMTRSLFYLPPEERHVLAAQYMYDFKTAETSLHPPTNVYGLWPEYESGGGGCISTVDDMIRFGEALRLGKLLKQETIDLMCESQIDHCLDSFILEDAYSYGLGVRCSRGDSSITEFGWGGAAGAGLWVDRKNGLTVYYAQHVLNSPVVKKRNQIMYVIKDCLGIAKLEDNIYAEQDSTRDSFAAKFGN